MSVINVKYKDIPVESGRFYKVEDTMANITPTLNKVDYQSNIGKTPVEAVFHIKNKIIDLMNHLTLLSGNTVKYMNEIGIEFDKADQGDVVAAAFMPGGSCAVKANGKVHMTKIEDTGSPATGSIERAQGYYPKLTPTMANYSMNQNDYNAFYSGGMNIGCCATAYAIGLSITTGEPQNPVDYWDYNQCVYKAGGIGEYNKNISLNQIYNALKEGKPSMLHYGHQSGQHWVVITGVEDGADINNLRYEDFIVIDPWSGKEVPLPQMVEYSSFNPWGMQIFT